MNRFEPLNATLGYFAIENGIDLDVEEQKFFGPSSFPYNAVLKSLRNKNVHFNFIATKMEASSGSCDEQFNCTGQLRTFQIENWDLSLMAQSHSILRFSGSNSPFIVGPTVIESSLHILSGVNQSQLIEPENVEVTESFKKLGVELLILYVLWFVIAYLLSVIFRKTIYSMRLRTPKSKLRHDKVIWEMMAGILNQFRYYPDHNSVRVLWWSFLISMFMFDEYYNGLFSTELTVKAEPYKIEDLEGVAASSAFPFFTNVDSGSVSTFEESTDPLMKAVYTNYKANDESEFEKYPEPSGATIIKYKNLIKNLKAILIGQLPLVTMYKFLDCAEKDAENYHLANEELHLASKSYHPVLFSWLFNRNINDELRQRMTSSFRVAVETGLFQFMLECHFFREALDLSGLLIKGGGRSQECLYDDKRAENHPRSMAMGDMVTLFRGFSGAMSIATCLMVFEMFLNVVRSSRRKRRVCVFTRTPLDVRHMIRQSKGLAS